MYQNNKQDQKGFTLIELMLAVGFVGGLLVLIALIVMQIMGLYNKGLTLKEVDEVSRVVVRDMQQSISSADAFKLEYVDSTTRKPRPATTLRQAIENGELDYYSNDAGGRLCTGVYSYMWNTAGALRKIRDAKLSIGAEDVKTYKHENTIGGSADGYPIQFVTRTLANGGTRDMPIRFVKKQDPGKTMCRLPADDIIETTRHDKMLGPEGEYASVFGADNDTLTVYQFDITTPLRPTSDRPTNEITAVSTFYYIKMTLGTRNGDENVENGLIKSNEVCKPPSQATQNQGEYCAVNKLEFVARTGRIGN